MRNPFELTDEEKACTVGEEQLAMFQRLVDFVNERLSEIETLQDKVDQLENPSK